MFTALPAFSSFISKSPSTRMVILPFSAFRILISVERSALKSTLPSLLIISVIGKIPSVPISWAVISPSVRIVNAFSSDGRLSSTMRFVRNGLSASPAIAAVIQIFLPVTLASAESSGSPFFKWPSAVSSILPSALETFSSKSTSLRS